MSNYAIMRCKKIKTFGSGAALLQHNYRERETLNADSDRTHLNEHLAAKNTNEAMGRWRELLPERVRKNAVLMIEYVMTTSPEWAQSATPEQQQDFFDQSMDWLEKKYGSDNIVVATIQRDELTPHLSAFVVPLTDEKKLSAKQFIGSRDKLRSDQTSFAKCVAHLGLKRGIEGSTAKHQRVKTHYAQINQEVASVPKITAEEIKPQKVSVLKKETDQQIVERINKKIGQATAPMAARVSVIEQERRKIRGIREVYQRAEKRLSRLKSAFNTLSEKQVTTVKKLIGRFQRRNDEQRQIRKAQLRNIRSKKKSRSRSI